MSLRSSTLLSVALLVVIAVLLRLVLIHLDYPPDLSSSIHFVTPLTSLPRLRDSIYLRHHAQPTRATSLSEAELASYGSYHPVLLLRFFEFVDNASVQLGLNDLLSRYFFVLCDVFVGLLLLALWSQYSESNTKIRSRSRSHDYGWLPLVVVGGFLLNPLSVLSCVAGSLGIISHVLVLCSIVAVGRKLDSIAAICLALGTYVSVYPLVFVLFLLWALGSLSWKRLFWFGLIWTETISLLYVTSSWCAGSNFWEVYVNWYQVSDMTPNWGLFWYFLTECFPSFRTFFLILFHVHVLCYPWPLAFRFPKDLTFSMAMLVVITATFNAYPGLGDHAFGYALLAIVQEPIAKHLKYSYLCFAAILLTLVSGPVFYVSWIDYGTGNVNFFFFVLLAFVGANFVLVLDFVGAKIRERDCRRLTAALAWKSDDQKKSD